jgi:hypothetical protein
MRNRSRLLKTQHFAEEGFLARHVNPCAPVVYERRWNCKLKTWELQVARCRPSS